MAYITPKLSTDALARLTNLYFEPQLRQLNLADEQIENQDLEQLENSLGIVDDAIKNPDSFGKMRIAYAFESGEVIPIIAKSGSDYNVEVGILPLLLERKKRILDRINLLRGEEKIVNLRDLIERVPEENIRTDLQKEIDSLEAHAQKYSEQTEEIDEAQEKEKIRIKAEIDALSVKTELFERRSKVLQSFLERESVATIIGGILLLIFGVAYVFAMFLHIVPLDIMNNSFLVILGYFFGQTVARASLGSRESQNVDVVLKSDNPGQS
jgi:hypothetical protein